MKGVLSSRVVSSIVAHHKAHKWIKRIMVFIMEGKKGPAPGGLNVIQAQFHSLIYPFSSSSQSSEEEECLEWRSHRECQCTVDCSEITGLGLNQFNLRAFQHSCELLSSSVSLTCFIKCFCKLFFFCLWKYGVNIQVAFPGQGSSSATLLFLFSIWPKHVLTFLHLTLHVQPECCLSKQSDGWPLSIKASWFVSTHTLWPAFQMSTASLWMCLMAPRRLEKLPYQQSVQVLPKITFQVQHVYIFCKKSTRLACIYTEWCMCFCTLGSTCGIALLCLRVSAFQQTIKKGFFEDPPSLLYAFFRRLTLLTTLQT